MASKAEELLKAARQRNQTHIDPITGGDTDEDNGAMEDILASLQSDTETAAAPTIPATTIEEAFVSAPAIEAPAVEAPAIEAEAQVEHKSMAGVRTMSRTQAELARGREALAGVKAARAHTEAMSSRTVITDADEDKDGEAGRAKVEGRAKSRK
jgi:hypothetical protein